MYRKRLIALAAALLLMTVGVVVYFIVHGSTYTEDLEWMDDPKMTEDDLSVEVDNENIVRADRVYLNEDRKFCVDFHSVGGGTTAVTYFVKDRFTYKTELFVNEFGTIIAKDSLNFDGYVQVEILMIVGLALILLVMLSCFIESWIKARFSYSMVGYGGVALFSASVITVVIYGMQWMNTFARFLNNIMETGFLFAFVSAPVMLIISLAISLSNIRLISREGFSIRNMLGVLLGVGWIVGLFLVILSSNMMLDFSESVMARISYSIAYVISFMACMLLSTIACAFLAAKHRPPYDRDYILILGCSICPDGSLTPILKNRADAAIRFEKEQFSASGRHAKFVPSGGKGDDEIISEGEAMARYLREQGYPDSQIIIEDKSVNTSQNI